MKVMEIHGHPQTSIQFVYELYMMRLDKKGPMYHGKIMQGWKSLLTSYQLKLITTTIDHQQSDIFSISCVWMYSSLEKQMIKFMRFFIKYYHLHQSLVFLMSITSNVSPSLYWHPWCAFRLKIWWFNSDVNILKLHPR